MTQGSKYLLLLLIVHFLGCSKVYLKKTNYENGKVKEEFYVKENRLFGTEEKHGKYILFYKNGIKKEEREYKNGIIDGKITSWYKNGKKSSVYSHTNGVSHGIHTIWYENGKKQFETAFKNGVQTGKSITWFENGMMERECQGEDSEENMICKSWYSDGTKRVSKKISIQFTDSDIHDLITKSMDCVLDKKSGIVLSFYQNPTSETKQFYSWLTSEIDQDTVILDVNNEHASGIATIMPGMVIEVDNSHAAYVEIDSNCGDVFCDEKFDRELKKCVDNYFSN